MFTAAGNMRELGREEVTPTRPECYAGLVSVAIKLDFVQPLLAFRDVLNGEGYIGSIDCMVPDLVASTASTLKAPTGNC